VPGVFGKPRPDPGAVGHVDQDPAAGLEHPMGLAEDFPVGVRLVDVAQRVSQDQHAVERLVVESCPAGVALDKPDLSPLLGGPFPAALEKAEHLAIVAGIQIMFTEGNFAEAAKLFSDLITKWNVDPKYYKQVVLMLLDLHLETGSPAEIVRYFEIVIEKYPELEIPFATILKVGDAYHKIGEYERSYLVFRAAVEGSFLRESQVPGFLNREGEFLRSVGKHFTLSYMLQKESVKSRLEDGISYTEFSYMLLQAYDFLHLYREHGVELQMGGSDQWGNITAGRELVRRVTGGEVHGLCAPLLTTATGAKFGKTEEGALWLDADLTSPYQLFQYWMNADDRDVERYLGVFTFRSREEIAGLMEEHGGAAGARVPHRALADEVTTRVHGEDASRRASDASRVLFGELDPRDADAGTWGMLASELPSADVDLSSPVPAVDAVVAAGLAKSKGEARRLLGQGGITLNGAPLGVDASVGPDDVLAGRYVWLRRGKKTDAVLVTAAP